MNTKSIRFTQTKQPCSDLNHWPFRSPAGLIQCWMRRKGTSNWWTGLWRFLSSAAQSCINTHWSFCQDGWPLDWCWCFTKLEMWGSDSDTDWWSPAPAPCVHQSSGQRRCQNLFLNSPSLYHQPLDHDHGSVRLSFSWKCFKNAIYLQSISSPD